MVTFSNPNLTPTPGDVWYVKTHYLAGPVKVISKTLFGRYVVTLLEIRGIRTTLPKKAFVRRLPVWPRQQSTES